MYVRRAGSGDLSEIVSIQRSSREAAQWDPSDYELLVAECDGRIAGFLAWRSVARDEAEILNLAVAETFRGLGAAESLVRAVPFSIIFLEVRESNAAARALYRKCGFMEAGIRFGYYSHPTESGIVMRLQS